MQFVLCRYYDYRYPPGHEKQYAHTMKFWHILAAKLAFIIVMEVSQRRCFPFFLTDRGKYGIKLINYHYVPFVLPQHVVFVVKFFVAWLIPDIPIDIKARITRERYLIQEYLHSYEMGRLTMQLSASFATEPNSEPLQSMDVQDVLTE